MTQQRELALLDDGRAECEARDGVLSISDYLVLTLSLIVALVYTSHVAMPA